MFAGHRGEIAVRVSAPARLHLGFLDLAFDMGRRFGSLGLAIDWPVTVVEIAPAPRLIAKGPDAERARSTVATLAEKLRLDANVAVTVAQSIPAHSGFGSGTQLALATAAAFCTLHGIAFRCPGDRRPAGAGRTDLDRNSKPLRREVFSSMAASAAPAGSRPSSRACRFRRNGGSFSCLTAPRPGLHGPAEGHAFREAAPFPPASADHLCRLALLKALPALSERDIDAFGGAVAAMQKVLGDHFAPMQGGGRFTSCKVEQALTILEAQGIGIGQSSWGPTGFAFLPSEAEALRLRDALAMRFEDPDLAFVVCRARNSGARISCVTREQSERELETCPSRTSSTCSLL